MKLPIHLALPALVSLFAANVSLAQTPPAAVPVPVPVAPPGTVIEEETTRIAAVADPSLDRREGKVATVDAETKKLMLRTKLAKEPIGFSYNSATKYIDLDGKPFDPSLLKPEVPVTVDFVENGNELVASTILVQRVQAVLPGGGVTLTMRETRKPGGVMLEESQKTTTIVHSGTVRTFDPEYLIVQEEGQAHPVRYQYSKTTTWVNEAGEPVAADLVKAGLPVRVKHSRRGDAFFADQVVIVTATPAPAPAIKEPGELPK